MMAIFGFLGNWLGWILWAAFYFIRDFGLAIIVFTIVVKLITFPFSIKQQKSMAKTAKFSKKQQEIREKYANNKQLQNEEIQKLYEKEGISPMGGGCLTTLIPMIILFGVFYAVGWPLSNTLHIDGNSVNNAIAYVNTIPGYSATTGMYNYQEINLLKIFPHIANTSAMNNIFTQTDIASITELYGGFKMIGMIDLLAIPSDYGFFSPYMLFPVLCFASNVGSQLIMQKVNANMQQQQGCMKILIFGLPLFSAYIAYVVPCAMAFYWIISAVLSLIQSIVLAKVFSPAKTTANSEARHIALMLENEAKVPYIYAPQEAVASSNKQSKKKK